MMSFKWHSSMSNCARFVSRASVTSRSSLVHDIPCHQRVTHASGNLQPEERRVLALALERTALDFPPLARIEHAHVRGVSDGETARAGGNEARRRAGDLRECVRDRNAIL